MKAALVIFAILGIGYWLLSSNDNSSYTPSYFYDSSSDYNEENVLSYDEAVDGYWSEIQDYLDGTEEIEACSNSSGNCYDLEADIDDGYIQTLYFNNGGYLEFYAEIDENGYAYDTDEDGNDWDFTISSYFIENAVEEWADDSGYTLE